MNDSAKIKIMPNKCDNCGICIDSCIVSAIESKDNKAIIDESKCNFCMACIPLCPQNAIYVDIGL